MSSHDAFAPEEIDNERTSVPDKKAPGGGNCKSHWIYCLIQKLIAEVIGTFFIVFAGCSSVVMNKVYQNVTFPGVAITWGLIVMVMIYSVGHISGGHFNPAVTVTFALFRRFPWKEVPLYIIAQLFGSLMASLLLHALVESEIDHFFGTTPANSAAQSFIIEFVISFLLMFVISGVATDTRAIGSLAGLAIGSTITLNVFVAGPISGASMNPARSIGPAIVIGNYKGLWAYIVGPFLGIFCGALVYSFIRFTDKPLHEITLSASFLKHIYKTDEPSRKGADNV